MFFLVLFSVQLFIHIPVSVQKDILISNFFINLFCFLYTVFRFFHVPFLFLLSVFLFNFFPSLFQSLTLYIFIVIPILRHFSVHFPILIINSFLFYSSKLEHLNQSVHNTGPLPRYCLQRIFFTK
jgi:hypothetical protein